MTIAPDYYAYGARYFATLGAGENWQSLQDSNVEFAACSDSRCESGDASRIVIMEAGSYGGDILDDSNGAALQVLHDEWAALDDVPAGAIDCHYGMGGYVRVCVDVGTVPADTLASMIDTAESFANYPVLDESDYSERELASFCEEFRWNSSRLSADMDIELDKDHPLWGEATDYAMHVYYGYSDPGWISEEHVRECWIEAGVTFTD